MKSMKLVAIALATALIGGPALADELELTFGHVGKPGSLFEISVNEFAERANEKLAGKATVVAFGSSQLGKDKELLQKLKLGTVTFSLPSTVMSTVADQFGLFEMPYLVKSRDHMARIEDEIFWEQIAPTAEAKGYKVLAVWENGFRHITNNVRPINVPAGLGGDQAAHAEGHLAGQDVQDLWRQPDAHVLLRGLHRPQDRRDRRPGEPLRPDL